jgi:hypothetical protein
VSVILTGVVQLTPWLVDVVAKTSNDGTVVRFAQLPNGRIGE